MTHKEWLENEYRLWVQALQASTPDNFKEHPQVRRMLGDIPFGPIPLEPDLLETIRQIDSIGWNVPLAQPSGTCWRMVYFARRVLLQMEPPSVVEIGGGAGEFYAILRALGYRGKYYILDLPEVQDFQRMYLEAVEQRVGLSLPLELHFDYCVSFYALGEFDDELKAYYIENVVSRCPHGLVAWNPHSGASDQINFPCVVVEELDGCKVLAW